MNNFTNFVPIVIEQDGRAEKQYDLYSRLLKDRIIWVGAINEQSANIINAQLLFLLMEDKKKPIKMYINSPGGSVLDGDSIIDTMDFVKSKGVTIETMVIGKAASYGAIILANGSEGHRKVLPRSRVMVHQPLGGAKGQASDIQREAELIIKMKNEITDFLVEKTGQTRKQIEKDLDRDTWFRGQEAVDYGLADALVKTK